MKTTVRPLTSPHDLDDGKTYQDLPILFEGTVDECGGFCQNQGEIGEYFWVAENNVFGGYYANDKGNCLLFV